MNAEDQSLQDEIQRGLWELIVKRTLAPAEQAELKRLNIFHVNKDGKFQFRDLRDAYKEQIWQRLSERRVVQHIPARMTGLRVEQNVWRVFVTHQQWNVLCRYFPSNSPEIPFE